MRQGTNCQTLYFSSLLRGGLAVGSSGWIVEPEKVSAGRHRTLDIDGRSVYIPQSPCGRSSVVERHVANVNVVSSNLIARLSRPGTFGCQALSHSATPCHPNRLRTKPALNPVPTEKSIPTDLKMN